MTKMLQVTDVQYDWFAARARGGHSIVTVVTSIIALVDRVEADLEKYNKWVAATKPKTEQGRLK